MPTIPYGDEAVRAKPSGRVTAPPFQPGKTGNPGGANQWTYRRNFEKAMAALAEGGTGLSTAPIGKGGRSTKPCHWCRLPDSDVMVEELGPMHETCVDRARALTRGDLFARLLWSRALAGEEWAAKLLASRLWPETHTLNLGAAGEDKGSGAAAAFDALPREQRQLVGQALSAVLQGKPELAGETVTDAELVATPSQPQPRDDTPDP